MKKIINRYFMSAIVVLGTAFFVPGLLYAQSIAENVLDDVLISKSDYTGIIKIKFRLPVRYISHSPKGSASKIRIKVDVISKVGNEIKNEEFSIRESIVPQYKHSFGLEEVIYETVGRDNYVTLYFKKDVSFEIVHDPSYRSLNVVIHGVK